MARHGGQRPPAVFEVGVADERLRSKAAATENTPREPWARGLVYNGASGI